MSFILDALKKSESDRQRQSGPSLFEVKVAPPRRSLPIVGAAIAVLLGINIVVISWMWLRHPATPEPPAAKVQTAPAPAVANTAPGAPMVAQEPARRTSSDVPGRAVEGAAPPAAASRSASSAPPAAAQTVSPSQPSAGSQDTDTEPGNTAVPTATDNPTDYAPAVDPAANPEPRVTEGTADSLPLYRQIASSAALPPLHLDLHVFAPRPQDSFVMINMRRLQEGDTLPSGVEVQTIRPDGVVLSYHGNRFLLPRN